MAQVKKGSKLSRKHSQNTLASQGVSQSQTSDDSLDDFQPIFIAERNRRGRSCLSASQPISTSLTALKEPTVRKFESIQEAVKAPCEQENATSDSNIKSLSPCKSPVEEPSRQEKDINLLPCPVCGKRFKLQIARQTHLRSCGNAHGLSLEAIKGAVQLQEKQAEERKSLGLPCFPQAPSRPKGNKRTSKEAVVNENDLQMALALSVSLEHAKHEALQKEEELLVEEGLEEQLIQKRHEEEEKEKTRTAFLASFAQPQVPRKRKKNLRPEDFILVKRSKEDRQRVLSERITEVLAEELPNTEFLPRADEKFIKSDYLKAHYVKEKRLWDLAQTDNPKKEDYYVPALRVFVSPSKSGCENGRFFHWSQIAGRLPSPGKNVPSAKLVRSLLESSMSFGDTQAALEDLAKEHITGAGSVTESQICEKNLSGTQSCGNGFHYQDNDVMFKVPFSSDNGHFETLAMDWKHYVNNSTLSDIVVRVQESQELFAHQLVLQVRAPLVLQDLKTVNDQKTLLWTHLTHQAAFSLLLYAYSGYVQVSLLNSQEKASLKYCAHKYALVGLIDALQDVLPLAIPIDDEIVEKPLGSCPSPDLFCESDVEDEATCQNSVGDEHDSYPLQKCLSKDVFDEPEKEINILEKNNVVDLTQSSPEIVSEPRTPQNSQSEEVPCELNEGRLSLSPIEALRDDCNSERSNSPVFLGSSSTNLRISNVWEGFEDQCHYNELSISETAPIMSEMEARASIALPTEFKTPTSNAPMPRILLQSSTPDIGFDVNDSVLWRSENEPSLRDSPVSSLRKQAGSIPSTSWRTPELGVKKKRKRNEVAVTPLPDYQEMPTPELKKALDKFGLKPLKRKNAVKMLNHIYDSTHPWVTDSESEASFVELPKTSEILEVIPDERSDDEEFMSSQTSEVMEESLMMDFEEFDALESPSTSGRDKDAQFLEFIKNKPDLWNQVLQYEPIPFETLLSHMRKSGIKAKPNELMDWLDEQCITFRIMKSRRGRTKSLPKKNAKPSPVKSKRVK